jgi:cytochrome oxidase Cu insertion factor (SCO1/SenC/PrrC family)
MKFRALLLASVVYIFAVSPASCEAENGVRKTYLKLDEEYKAAMDVYTKKLDSITDDKQRAAAKLGDPTLVYLPRFARIMKEHPSDPAALDAAIWVATSDTKNSEFISDGLRLIRERFVSSDKLAALIQTLRRSDSPEAVNLLRAVKEKNSSKKLQALATLTLAQKLFAQNSPDAEALFEDLLKNYSAIENIGRLKGTFSEIANKYLYEIRNLSLGKVAPNIQGEDASGKRMSLDDYRGKVVLLTFWGDW